MDIGLLGLAKAKQTQLTKKGFESIEDVVKFFPKKYYDFRSIVPIRNAIHDKMTAVVGVCQSIQVLPKCVKAKFKDSTNKVLHVTWFNSIFMGKFIKKGETYIIAGKIELNPEYSSVSMVNPVLISKDIKGNQRIMPVYSKISGMSDEFLQKTIQTALSIMDKRDYLEPFLLEKFGIPRQSVGFRNMHQPLDELHFQQARKRMLFDDLFLFALQLEEKEMHAKGQSPYVMKNADTLRPFISSLPFDLTEGQYESVKSLFVKMRKGSRANALVQGDVGSGKTIVAILLMMISAENNYQSVLMAPTTVLAKQHYEDLVKLTKPFGYKVGFLSGDIKVKERRELLKSIKDGTIQFVVGTHAVLSDDVEFDSLALTVVDEEHRFGVAQRNKLNEKAREGVHAISMSATPIPRTLALTLYGDSIDVLTIKTLPKGRKPIQTLRISTEDKTYEAMYRQIKEGRQCYVVCPLIEDSTYEGLEHVDSVEKTFEKMTNYFHDKPDIKVGMISGKMKQVEIAEEIERFSRNEYQIIISTTIIEVGVNVPNATVILIKDAERFGLAQLHQLRGRVGRGSHQSYCILLSKDRENEKLKAMAETTDGFEISKRDLALRGTGAFIGTKQSGNNVYLEKKLKYPAFFDKIKEEVKIICQDEKRFNFYRHLLKEELQEA